jgi:hypothetical protein
MGVGLLVDSAGYHVAGSLTLGFQRRGAGTDRRAAGSDITD